MRRKGKCNIHTYKIVISLSLSLSLSFYFFFFGVVPSYRPSVLCVQMRIS